MVRACRIVLSGLALAVVAAGAFAQSVQVQVQPQRGADNKLTGRYVAKVSVVGAKTARLVVFRLNVPTAYQMATGAVTNQTWLVDVVPGADVYKLPASADSAQPPVFFAELATDVAGRHGLWGVALLVDTEKTPKHVCNIVFTSKGRVTTEALAFQAGTVSVKDQALAQLTNQGTFSGTAAPKFGDVNWNGQIDGDDFGLFAATWSAYFGDPSITLDFADLAPLNNDADSLTQRTSKSDGKITGQDLGMFAWAWNKFFAGTSKAPATAQANKEGAK